MFSQPFIPRNTEAIKEWFEKEGEKFCQEIGLIKGQKVMDLGCGVGTYAIPAAKTVGKIGKVYAIDKDENSIKELATRIEKNNLTHILEPIQTDGSFNFPIEDEVIDNSLLIDFLGVVIHHSKDVQPIKKLMKEIYRVTKPTGKITIIFKHLHNWQIPKKQVELIINKYFALEKTKTLPHIHWDTKEIGAVYSYKKY